MAVGRFKEARIPDVILPRGRRSRPSMGALRIAQYGRVFSVLVSIAQTSDGYLWLGTGAGLVRFDGVKFEPFDAISDARLLHYDVYGLWAAPSGGLWIGYATGGATFFKDGHASNFGENEGLGRSSVSAFAEDGAGNLWAGTGGGVTRFDRSRWRIAGSEEKYSFGPTPGTLELADALIAHGEHLANDGSIKLKTVVQGQPRSLHPVVFEEALHIGREALANAFHHSKATQIELEIVYERREFSLRVRDDGVGIDPSAELSGNRPGHFGLIGMRERSNKIRARIDFWSRPGAGTEIALRIPSAMAYRARNRAWK
jgi:hypothetical protein